MSSATTFAPAPVQTSSRLGSWFGIIPGLLLLAAVGFLGKFIEQSISRYGKAHHLVLPNIEYVLWAILIGLLIANTIGVPALFRRGVATYEFWLKVGIVLLGARFVVGVIAHLGPISLALVFVEIGVALAFMTWLGKRFNLTPKLVSLLSVGASVCGVSAIIATQGAMEADEEDSSYAIAAIHRGVHARAGLWSGPRFPFVSQCDVVTAMLSRYGSQSADADSERVRHCCHDCVV